MKNKKKKFSRSLIFNMVGSIAVALLLFGIVASIVGYVNFTDSFTREYTEEATRIARTASKLVNGDHIDNYLAGEQMEEHDLSQGYMDFLCDEMNATFIYVIKVDTSDYNSFVSVFNSVNKNSTKYTAWEVGYYRKTTNEEYRKTYQNLYEKKIDNAHIYRTTNLNGAAPHITSLIPVFDSSQNVVSLLCVQTEMAELAAGRNYYLWNVAILTFVLVVIISITSTLYFKWQYVNPLKKVKEEAERFAENSSEPKEHLTETLSKINEISSLAVSIDTMEKEILEYVDNIKNITAEKQRIGTELQIASVIQESSIPSVFPKSNKYDIFATMTPAKEVGGDFYDFFEIDDDHVAMVMADVSGKGVPAALFMMVTKILIKERTLMGGGTPAEILEFVNQRICANNRADMFVTVWLGILELSSGKIIATNAGHDDPAIYRKNKAYEIVKNKHGIIVGAMENAKFVNFELQLKKGDKIFLYTDGVTEAKNSEGKMFTFDNMVNTLNNNKDNAPKQTLDAMKQDIDKFVNDAPQFDDITMLCLELKDDNAKVDKQTQSKSLVVDALTENLDKVLNFVNSSLKENDCPQKIQKQIDVAVEELFTNTAHYAYDKIGDIEISIAIENDVAKIILTDSGKQFNPLDKELPDTSLSAQERNIGGLGIFLVKKYMDNVEYKYENNKNILILNKKIK